MIEKIRRKNQEIVHNSHKNVKDGLEKQRKGVQ